MGERAFPPAIIVPTGHPRIGGGDPLSGARNGAKPGPSRPIFFDARKGTFADFGGALRRPFALTPFIERHRYISGCWPIYRDRMSHLTVPRHRQRHEGE
jgi:hypothetical protein